MPGTGTNVIAKLQGEVDEQIVMGAHYDTWFTGSSDNSGGVAELLEVAHRRVQRGKPHYTEVFVAFDGEEIGLYGGYDYYRKHDIVAEESRSSSCSTSSARGDRSRTSRRSCTRISPSSTTRCRPRTSARSIRSTRASRSSRRSSAASSRPTSKAIYRGGTPAVSTAVDFPYYHTVKDTPDTVDLPLLASIDRWLRCRDLEHRHARGRRSESSRSDAVERRHHAAHRRDRRAGRCQRRDRHAAAQHHGEGVVSRRRLHAHRARDRRVTDANGMRDRDGAVDGQVTSEQLPARDGGSDVPARREDHSDRLIDIADHLLDLPGYDSPAPKKTSTVLILPALNV